jgi:NTP pyrophosphatase (non-canonical NTP hydrolase)
MNIPKDNYIELANVTMSDEWNGAAVSKAEFIATLESVIKGLNRLDQIKKAMFYGRELPGGQDSGPTLETLDMDLTPVGMTMRDGRRLVHGLIGAATEAGELLEAIVKAIDNKEPLDKVNLIEEIGDGLWYAAAVMRVCNTDFASVQQINIDKLKKRFPNGFSMVDANVRNLVVERAVLETGVFGETGQ